MNDELKQEQACLYVLGLLSAGEAAAFERDADAGTRKLVGELRSAAGALPSICAPIEPPPALKTAIFAEIDSRQSAAAAPEKMAALASAPRRASAIGWFGWVGWVAAATLVFGCSLLFIAQMKSSSKTAELQGAVETAKREADAAREQLRNLQERVAELTKGNLKNQQLIRLGPPDNSTPVAMVAWDQGKQQGTLLVDNLPKPPADKDYQLWVLDAAGKPIDCGVFPVTASGVTTFDFGAKGNVDRANKFAITLEPKGGLPSPTLKAMVLIGG